MKRIAISLATIAAMLTMTVAATGAYFSDTKAITGNTFSTGTVTIGDMTNTHIAATNLEPGVWSQGYELDVPYTGSLNADLYGGVTGDGSTYRLADQLTVQIYNKDTGAVVYQDLASKLSSSWAEIAANVNPGTWNHFSVAFYLDPSFSAQGVTNADTVFLIYAVQANGPSPQTVAVPYGFHNIY